MIPPPIGERAVRPVLPGQSDRRSGRVGRRAPVRTVRSPQGDIPRKEDPVAPEVDPERAGHHPDEIGLLLDPERIGRRDGAHFGAVFDPVPALPVSGKVEQRPVDGAVRPALERQRFQFRGAR